MNAIPVVLRALHDGERRLERDLLAVAHRHKAEHELHHVAIDLARWSHEQAERIDHAAELHGLLPGLACSLTTTVREETTRAPDGELETGLLLLHDLCRLHLAATENSLNWEMLAQAAQATGDNGLLDLAAACHPRTLRQIGWTNTMIKTLSPQLLASAL